MPAADPTASPSGDADVRGVAPAVADRTQLLEFVRAFSEGVPHNEALGLELVELLASTATMRLPYRLDLVGNADTGVLHGGAITALLDATSGLAVFAALTELKVIATLDLRIDYLRGAEPGQAVLAKADCYKLAREVAFTRAVAHHGDPSQPIAQAVGTFMVGTRGSPK